MQSAKSSDSKRDFAYDVAVALRGSDRPEFRCALLRIGTGLLHLLSERWIEPGLKITARFDHITLEGTVNYSKPRGDDYLIGIDIAMESTQSRRELRFPIHMPGTVILIGDHGTSVMNGVITDISSSGLGLKIPFRAEVLSSICVETAKLLVVGEVRHCNPVSDGFSVGIMLTDIFFDQIQPDGRSPAGV